MSMAVLIKRTMEKTTTRNSTRRSLQWLLAGMADAPAVPIRGISTDSRAITQGDAFLACQGATTHGLEYVEEAVGAGAVAIAWDSDTATGPIACEGVATVPVAGLSARLGVIANRWFDAPSAQMNVSGVTGTNGKTTVAWLIAQCLQKLDKQCAYMGTLGAGMATLDRQVGLTTPGCIDLHRNLAEFVSRGAEHAALEVSSHALDQGRVDGVRFDTVLFTNLSRDHIDYHGDMSSYFETKARFILAQDIRHRIINVDTKFGRQLAGRSTHSVVQVSTLVDGDADPGVFVHMRAVDRDERGSTVDVRSSWGTDHFYLPLAGDFNVANAALALAQLLCWEVPLMDAIGALSTVLPPPGRMQEVEAEAGIRAPSVFVDYAHTPAGLEAVLRTLRNHCRGELWCVFGCGGDRDTGKRRTMGETVARLADRPVVTSDNPRSEPPGKIIEAVLSGMDEGTVAIEDRSAAIAHAIAHAMDDDVILIAGKGHEDYQIIGSTRRPFSDYQVARTNLNARCAAGRRRQ
jgi:UDP-N-acetylmuramoyl-L-alanyl-D-glutamate--2,6-diaminopimelate ligase